MTARDLHPARGSLPAAIAIMAVRMADAELRAYTAPVGSAASARWYRIAATRKKAIWRLAWALEDRGGAS